MQLKFNREEIAWIDPKHLTKEVAKDLMGFWLETDQNILCCARHEDGSTKYEYGKKVAWYFFNQEKEEWQFLKHP
jgi:hypothetical protein